MSKKVAIISSNNLSYNFPMIFLIDNIRLVGPTPSSLWVTPLSPFVAGPHDDPPPRAGKLWFLVIFVVAFFG